MAKYQNKETGKIIEGVQWKGYKGTYGCDDFSEQPDWLIEAFGEEILYFQERDTLTIVNKWGKEVLRPNWYVMRHYISDSWQLSVIPPENLNRSYKKVEVLKELF